MSTVSVVIPAYNSAPFIASALHDARAQTRAALEVLVVDDGSTDETAAIARQLGATVLTTPENGGPAAARNLGIQAARGDFIAFLDADDSWDPGHCALLAGLLERHPTALVAFGPVRSFGFYKGDNTVPGRPGVPQSVLISLVAGNFITQSSTMARRETLLGVGGYRSEIRFAEDYDLWLRLAERGPFVCADRITAGYRSHQGQVTRRERAIVAGAWQARLECWRALEPALDPSERAALETALHRAYRRDLRRAWQAADRPRARSVLELGPTLPGGRPAYRRWRILDRLLWPTWSTGVALYRRVRGRTRLNPSDAASSTHTT